MRAFSANNNWLFRSARVAVATLLVLLTLAVPASVAPAQAATGIPPAEYDALEVFFKVMSGAGWFDKTHWFMGDPCLNNWYGVICNPTDTHVIGIEMVTNNLMGEIHKVDLTSLPYLETFDLSGNSIKGDIGGLNVLKNPRLTTLRLTANLIGGNIEALDLHRNHRLVTLSLSVNYIGGDIANMYLRRNPNLETLGLAINYIGGDIGGLDLSGNPKLENLILHSNQIKGDPSYMDFSYNPLVRQFTLSSNLVDGTVPDLTMTAITHPPTGWLWMCGGANVVRPSGNMMVDDFADKFDPTWSAIGGCTP